MLTIWGRATSSNVQKVLWTCEELSLAFERMEAGREHGQVDQDWYAAMNPNRLVPTLRDGELILWESNTIMRYLANRYGGAALYPVEPGPRALVERWMDWQLSILAPAIAPVFWGLIRPPAGGVDPAQLAGHVDRLARTWALVDRELAQHPYVAGDRLSLADIAMGNSVRRWYAFSFERPDLPNLAAWYARLGERPGFRKHLMGPVV
ncbi:MAG TPA: glutathione S-transferase family protein [Aliidongia sp.]|uniref:glutathione S-transferase family protein n=1 Tax=Aliidongia sp. TaxID=1914230 RepID=UPI002DDDA4A3|nr:glutathione S-transferase family protein [Aliidongia sp.]HEV2676796.1 glutathione S-transferase family protein [Aliidongia sp.]